MAYKKLIKVSNVCQLLDKSKYPATTTRSGITWTNNGDGTITANGTTNEVYVGYPIPIPQFKEVKNDHKYVLFSGINDINVSFVECICFLVEQDGSYFAINCAETKFADTVGFVIPQGEYPLWQRVDLRVRRGYTANDLTFKPQLFDLTEMYGAGNEPTTIEQFRQDFPEEMYDYSPYCWLTSYKRVFMTGEGSYLTSYQRNLTCKTKNLFDINSVSNLNNWVTKPAADRPYAYYQFNLKPNTIYTFQRNYESRNNEVYACFSEEYGVAGGQWFIHPTAPSLTRKQLSFTTNDTGIMYLNVYSVRSVLSSFIELIEGAQLELGDTATDYVPYGHL